VNTVEYRLKGLVCLLLLLILLTGCQQQQTKPQNESVESIYQNGSYIGYSNATDHGYAYAKFDIKNDNITDVELMEITSKGNKKDYDTYEYETSVKAYEEMPQRFEKENSAEVEVYSGATDSSKKYIEAVKNALKIAEGDLEGKYFSGKFQGSSEDASQYGYAVALITFKDDNITNAKLKEVTTGGSSRSFKNFSEYDYEPAVNANKEMAERFIDNDSAKVDTYTGATKSSKKYIDAVKDALLHASKSTDNLKNRKNDIDNR
jgi:uncharacterized protein with FMN-binding domain